MPATDVVAGELTLPAPTPAAAPGHAPLNVAPTLVYHRLGRGPDLLMLHGLLGWGAQWSASATLMAAHRTCWMPELPGISASSPIPDASLPGLRVWLESVVTALGLHTFDLVASSWGGALALEYASQHHARIGHLVLAAPTHPFWHPSSRQRLLLTPPVTRLAAHLGRYLPYRFYRALLGTNFAHPDRVSPARVAQYRNLLHRHGLGKAVANLARTWERDQQRLGSNLASITVPTLLIWGSRDRVVPVCGAEALRRALPHAQLAVLDGLGHLPFEEAPDAFSQTLLRFLG